LKEDEIELKIKDVKKCKGFEKISNDEAKEIIKAISHIGKSIFKIVSN